MSIPKTLLFIVFIIYTTQVNAADQESQVVSKEFSSKILKDNLLGIANNRKIKVYLPPSYQTTDKRFPVIYYLHNFFWDNTRMFEDGQVQRIFDRAIQRGVIGEFILVAADYTAPFIGSFYQNNKVSGRWLDYTLQEVLPYIDKNFRTIPNAHSRAITGDFIGGYGAIKLGMLHPDVFSSVYALHPVGTGLGYIPMVKRPNWNVMHEAKTYDDLGADIFSGVFTAMAQAYLPNSKRPPFYCDFMVEQKGGALEINVENSEKLRSRFLLNRLLPQYAANLRKLKAIKFDWARYDTNQDHVLSNQNFSRLLEEYDIEHEAEEYRGSPFEEVWTDYGRVYTDMLPFLHRSLNFESQI